MAKESQSSAEFGTNFFTSSDSILAQLFDCVDSIARIKFDEHAMHMKHDKHKWPDHGDHHAHGS